VISPVLPTYARFDVAFERGEGPWLVATDGRRYLDFASGIAVTCLGHAHPHLVACLKDQVEKLFHCSNLYRIPGQEKLAARLVENTFADTVFFGNSGAEAVECCIKMARRYQYAKGKSERYRVVVATTSFHGRTLATVFAGDQAKGKEGFGPAVDGFDRVPYGDIAAMQAAIGPETAAILLEPVQGEGGLVAAKPEYLQAVRALADEHDILFMLDEVQSGIGRTGTFFAYEQYGITPDVLASAKGIGGGFPMGACLATERAAAAMTAGSHGSTYGGNPLAMAAGNAVLDIVTGEGFLDHVQSIAKVLRDALQERVARFPHMFEEVRGLGLLAGLKCTAGVLNSEVIPRLFEKGMLTVPAGDNTIRFLPPLIIDASHVDEAMRILDAVCEAWEKK